MTKQHKPKGKPNSEAKAATDEKVHHAKAARLAMQIAVIVFGAIGTIGLAVFSAVYGHNKIGAIWFLFLPSALCLLIATSLQWHFLVAQEPSTESRGADPFFIEIEMSIVHDADAFSANRFYVGYQSGYGDTISPVDIVLFLRFVNLQTAPSLIQEYKVEVKFGNDNWVKLANIPMRGNQLFWVGMPTGFGKCREFGTDNTLDVLLQQKVLRPHEPIRGWVYLDVPRPYSAPAGATVQYRITLRDAAGAKLIYTSEPTATRKEVSPPGSSDTVQSREWHILPGYRDVSTHHQKYYYEPVP